LKNEIRVVVDGFEELRSMIASSSQLPFRFFGNESKEKLTSLKLKEISEVARSESGRVFSWTEAGNVLGVAACSDLPWESKIVGNRMGVLKCVAFSAEAPRPGDVLDGLLASAIPYAESQGIEFLLCKAYSDDIPLIHALERNQFLLVDTMLDFVCDFTRHPVRNAPQPRLPEGFTIRPAEDGDVNALKNLGGAAFGAHFGRFHSDERIPAKAARSVYEHWMEAVCTGYADWLLVADYKGTIAGCSAWKSPSPSEQTLCLGVGHYSIAGIHPDFSGLGLFTALTRAGMDLFAGTVRFIDGPTHINNYPVQRGYTKLGWTISDARHSFHRWLKE